MSTRAERLFNPGEKREHSSLATAFYGALALITPGKRAFELDMSFRHGWSDEAVRIFPDAYQEALR